MSAVQSAAALAALVDVLLPGDDDFPSASQVGTHLWLMEKIRSNYDPATIHTVVEAISPDFASQSEAVQIDRVRQFEQSQPDLFGFVRNAVYFGYYQTPLVVEAVRSLGRDYNHAPQPDGYDLAPFDPSTLPEQPRGAYVPTEAVERVDLSGIDMAGLEQQG